MNIFNIFARETSGGGFCETVTNAKVIKWPPQMQAAIFDRIFAKKKTGKETGEGRQQEEERGKEKLQSGSGSNDSRS